LKKKLMFLHLHLLKKSFLKALKHLKSLYALLGQPEMLMFENGLKIPYRTEQSIQYITPIKIH
jgi:hypothetical protein